MGMTSKYSNKRQPFEDPLTIIYGDVETRGRFNFGIPSQRKVSWCINVDQVDQVRLLVTSGIQRDSWIVSFVRHLHFISSTASHMFDGSKVNQSGYQTVAHSLPTAELLSSRTPSNYKYKFSLPHEKKYFTSSDPHPGISTHIFWHLFWHFT